MCGYGRFGHGVREALTKAGNEVTVIDKLHYGCLLYTSDAADERSSVDLGGRRIIKKKNKKELQGKHTTILTNHNTHITQNRRDNNNTYG